MTGRARVRGHSALASQAPFAIGRRSRSTRRPTGGCPPRSPLLSRSPRPPPSPTPSLSRPPSFSPLSHDPPSRIGLDKHSLGEILALLSASLATVAVCMPAALLVCLPAWRLLLGRAVRPGAGGNGSGGPTSTTATAIATTNVRCTIRQQWQQQPAPKDEPSRILRLVGVGAVMCKARTITGVHEIEGFACCLHPSAGEQC